jgi:hypothetical protein
MGSAMMRPPQIIEVPQLTPVRLRLRRAVAACVGDVEDHRVGAGPFHLEVAVTALVSIPCFWVSRVPWAASSRSLASARSSTSTPKWWMPL